jgi:HD superfamily phosphohydrolase
MKDSFSKNEELGFFYDSVHGRVSLDDLPSNFHQVLKCALTSPALDRLKRISQLGHTSLSYFSATHTRFAHALGTMLVMNKLFVHISNRRGGLPQNLRSIATVAFSEKVEKFKSVKDFLHCHLLLASLYQDVGELPFQKITSHYFRPSENAIGELKDALIFAHPQSWSSKNIFSVLALVRDGRMTIH